MKYAVLGGGMVGRVMALDLAADGNEVSLFDKDASVGDAVAGKGVEFATVDLVTEDGVRKAVGDADVAVGAVPGFMGFSTMKRVIECERDFVDISFMPEDARTLDPLARRKGVTVVYDCGVAPGVSNMAVGRAAAEMDKVEKVRIVVGGLPEERRWPYEYKAPFSPADVLEEYTRPARLVRNGEVVETPALSETELVEFDCVGVLEAFNTDGLRSLIDTVECPDMAEKTLRYPGHAELMRVLRETGFFSTEPVDVGGARVRPRDVTAKLLFPMWKLEEGEREFTVMRITVEGAIGGEKVRHAYHLLDRYDDASGFTSMSRSTGFPCTLASREVASRRFEEPGVHPPEVLGGNEALFRRILAGLEKRGVRVRFDSATVCSD